MYGRANYAYKQFTDTSYVHEIVVTLYFARYLLKVVEFNADFLS